jgi:hypothetical protein
MKIDDDQAEVPVHVMIVENQDERIGEDVEDVEVVINEDVVEEEEVRDDIEE